MTMRVVKRSLTLEECRNEGFQFFERHPFSATWSLEPRWLEKLDSDAMQAWQARQTRRVTVLDLARALAGRDAIELFNHVCRLVEEGARTIVINLKATTAVDSGGLGELLRCWVHIARADGTMPVVNAPSHFQKLMADTKIL